MGKSDLIQYETGDFISSRYRIIGSLGAGGMASVWRAIDEHTNREVAIKAAKIVAEENARKKAISRYKSEVKSFSSLLDARNVVKIFDMFEDKDYLIIVMECVDGGTLKNRFNDFNDMTLDELKFYFTRLCDALSKADENGIVHRDIKPDNIMISHQGEIQLGDFGIAIHSANDLEATSIIGTPKYMAPEVCDGQMATHLSDIYSLGALLYECATGVAPFVFNNGNSRASNVFLINAQKHVIPTYPRKINKNVPQGLENLIMKMLEKNPEFRPKTTQEIREMIIKVKENDSNNTKPYIYRSKQFLGKEDTKKSAKIGRTYDFLKNRFRSRFSIVYILLLLVPIILIGVAMAVLL